MQFQFSETILTKFIEMIKQTYPLSVMPAYLKSLRLPCRKIHAGFLLRITKISACKL